MEISREQLKLQLEENSQEPDIAYILLMDENGEVIIKTGEEQTNPFVWINISELIKNGGAATRITDNAKIGRVYEIAKAFKPLNLAGRMRGMMDMHRKIMGRDIPQEVFKDRIIIVGLTMAELEQIQRAKGRGQLLLP